MKIYTILAILAFTGCSQSMPNEVKEKTVPVSSEPKYSVKHYHGNSYAYYSSVTDIRYTGENTIEFKYDGKKIVICGQWRLSEE